MPNHAHQRVEPNPFQQPRIATPTVIRVADLVENVALRNRDTIQSHTANAETRHTAAYRMAEDPGLPLTDVQFVLGHAQLTTTQIYLSQPSEIAADERASAGRLVSAAR